MLTSEGTPRHRLCRSPKPRWCSCSKAAGAARQPLDRWLLERALLVCYSWESWQSAQRGGDDGEAAVWPGKLGLPLPAGATLRVLPLVTKTGQAQRASHPFACAWARVTSVRGQPAFALLGADLATVSIPVHWVSWLLVPLHPWEHTHGVACNVTCAAFNARLQTHLTSMGVWEGETSHSFRRGSLQADIAAAGHSPAEAVQHGQIRSDNTTYLHRGRHAKRARVALPCFVDVASLAPLQVSSSSPAPPPLAGVVQRPPGAGPPPACPCHALQYAHWCCSDLLLLLGPTRPCSGACR
jgi:hypothetical protein